MVGPKQYLTLYMTGTDDAAAYLRIVRGIEE